MNEHEANRLKCANSRAIEFERSQSEGDSVGDIIHMIEKALKPANRNRPCLCGSGKKYKKCCRGEHLVKFNQYKKEHNL